MMNVWRNGQILTWLTERTHMRPAETSSLSLVWPGTIAQLNPLVQNCVWDAVHTEAQRQINHVLEILDLEPEEQAYASDRG